MSTDDIGTPVQDSARSAGAGGTGRLPHPRGPLSDPVAEPAGRPGWTFGRALTAGFAAVVAINLLVGLVSIGALRDTVAEKDKVINVDTQLVLDVQNLIRIRNERAAANRAYLISGQQTYLDAQYAMDAQFDAEIDGIRKLVHTDQTRQLVDDIARLEDQFLVADRRPVALKQAGASPKAVAAAWNALTGDRDTLFDKLSELQRIEQRLADEGKAEATRRADRAAWLLAGLLVLGIVAATALAGWLTRRLRRRIGATVNEVQSASAELQATANQQAVGAREQATAMNEISTTVTELLATSQQISESAQRVTGVADRTAQAGREGRATVGNARESMVEIQRQVDAIVRHMLELGDKSQRIGAVLDIVSELAEQTNILAINSTIEAAGAGESGRRFAVVADEIRKLADRVGESTKEIRELIDVVRGAVNTTVMATEIGSKAVASGAAQVADVSVSFEQIVGLVDTTTEAAREIELSTKQQTTAVEQVNLAVANVAQTTRETEASSTQTLQTASQLRVLSTRLSALVEAGAHDR
ncbi:methyl-accepting chemotaxis protein [Spongisporangium articulatum]|uniref:Methyl-accepting chemotaxis protein n=1 Tax=Spongisporangium articulatum TaxID=3362603 RepID=A0ABW8AKK7_9ACTN